MESNKKFFLAGFVLATVVFIIGCPKKPPKVVPPVVPAPPVEEKIEEPTIRGDVFQSVPELSNVYFEYDKYGITDEAKVILKKNAEYLIAHPELEVLIEGHCCECGTNEYNMSLGQKRAQVIRDYYGKLGISLGRIATISYGEEKPINLNAGPPDSPQCRENRRAETKVRRISK